MAEHSDVLGSGTPCHGLAFETCTVYLGEPGSSEAIVEIRCTGPGCTNVWYPDPATGRDMKKVFQRRTNGRLHEWPRPVARLRSLPLVPQAVLFACLLGAAAAVLGILAGLPARFNLGSGMMLSALFMAVRSFIVPRGTGSKAHRDAILLFCLSWIPCTIGTAALAFLWR